MTASGMLVFPAADASRFGLILILLAGTLRSGERYPRGSGETTLP